MIVICFFMICTTVLVKSTRLSHGFDIAADSHMDLATCT